MTASGYIKIAILMGCVCVMVVFWFVYRLLQLPTERPGAVALEPVQTIGSQPGSQTPVAAAATASPNAASGIFAIANQYPNVHTAADVSSRTVGVLSRGEQAEVLGRSADSLWYEIRYGNGANGLGWVWADYVTLTTPGATVPVASSP